MNCKLLKHKTELDNQKMINAYNKKKLEKAQQEVEYYQEHQALKPEQDFNNYPKELAAAKADKQQILKDVIKDLTDIKVHLDH